MSCELAERDTRIWLIVDEFEYYLFFFFFVVGVGLH